MSATEMNEQEITDAFEEFISKQYMDELGKVVNLGLPALIIDFCELDRFNPALTDFLIDNPKNILAMFERAAKNIEIAEESEFKIRFTNFPDDRIIKIRDIRSANIGKLIAIEGLIRQASDVRPVATLAVFECPACGTQIEIIQNEQIMKEPAMCSCGRKGRFKMLEKKLVDTQRVVVEESTENIGGESQPRRLGCFLTEDLVEPKIEKKTAPGTRVTVIGIVRELPIIERGGSKTTRFDLIMEANNLDASEHEYEELDIKPEDVVLIKEMAANPEIYTKLTNSIAPSIYGYEGIKESIALQMFGGVQTKRPDHTKVRGDIHILLVGDPGVAKSQLLKYVSAISPKARYVSGKGASGAGITASVIKDEFLHGWSLEAGALVLANHGICCLAPETKIISDNRIVNIESLFNKKTKYNAESNGEKIEVCNISAEVPALRDNIIVNAKATKIRRKKHAGKMLELTFSDGNKILLTPDHKLINGDNLEWSKAENFGINQHIVAPLKIPAAQREITIRELIPESWTVKENNYARKHIGEKLKVDVITPEMAYLFGFIYGDGHVKITNRNSTIAIYQSAKNKEQIEKIKEYWDSFSFRHLKEYTRKTTSEIRGKKFKSNVKMLYAGSNLVAQIYNQLCGQKLRNILMMPQEQLKAFVSGLIDSDGCISVKHKGDYKTVAFDLLVSNDLETCSNLVMALKRFDVYSRIRPARNVISIQSTGRQDINNLIEETKKYSLKTSMLKLPEMLKDIASESDVVPKEKTAFICNEISKLNKSLLLSKGVWSTVYNLKHKKGMPTRSSLRMFRAKLGNHLSKEIVESMLTLEKRDIFLNRIIEIKEKEYDSYVYDLYVPELHNFVANGIIVHNCIDEIDKMEKDDRVAMHEAMEQQCLHYDTIITLADGSETKIGDFVEKMMELYKDKVVKGINCYILPTKDLNFEMLTTDWKNIVKTRIDRISKHVATKRFIEIKAGNGRRITVTPEHPVFVMENDKITTKRADEIQKGMWVPVPLKLPIEGAEQYFGVVPELIYNKRASQHIKVPAKNGAEIFRIAGYLISEGSRELNRTKIMGINFTNKDVVLLNDFEKNMKHVFGLKPYKQARIDRHGTRWMLRYVSRELVDFIEKVMPELLLKSKEKCIPDVIMLGRKENIAQLLSCLFEGDGHVSKKKNTVRIGYTSVSRRLVEQIQDLLLRFGIRSSITEHKGVYKLGITAHENIKLFLQNVGFVTETKNMVIKNYLGSKEGIRFIKDVVPVSGIVMNLLKKYKIKNVGDYKFSTMKFDHTKRGYCFSRKFLLKIVNLLRHNNADKNEIQFLDAMASGEIGWEKIRYAAEVPNKEQRWTYDMTIEPSHTFISQNMVLHNTVTISKANIHSTLKSETTILAAANPKLGRFDPYQPIGAQIDMPPTLLSRFDLIFAIRDMPNKENDEKLATHILESFRKPEALVPEIAPELMKKYIAYAKKSCHPKLTTEAINELKNFFVGLRSKRTSDSDEKIQPIPLTARQLEAMVRLSQASARVRLSELVTKIDAQRAINMMKMYLQKLGVDYETGEIDIDRIVTGITSSQRNRIMTIKELLKDLEGKYGSNIPIRDLVDAAKAKDIEEAKVEEIIDRMKRDGELFEPKHGIIRRMPK